MDFYEFYTGKAFDAYRFLGAHPSPEGVTFRTFAPNAAGVSVIGEFSGCSCQPMGWQERPMGKIYDGSFWELKAPDASPGMKYKYRMFQRDGKAVDHCDPYGFSMEKPPHTASIVRDLSAYRFRDGRWMKKRGAQLDKPLSLYEIHAGSWRRKSDGADGWYSYTELGELLIPYLLENGYNYVELMPLSEHPCDASWGYQNTGFFSPTARYGAPEDLMRLIDECHQSGIGVLLDFVPVHFAVDDYGLWNYDGTALYEYPSADVGRSAWGSCNFMHSRGEVRSFLQSAAHYWLEEYHFDGLRLDAVNNLIYWQGDPARGRNENALSFLREMNRGLKARHPQAILAAEDSSAFPGVTAPVDQGGLGFDYKWDMGWMHDTLSFFQSPPGDRPEKYHQLTFSMQYFYGERYLLPFSHDEVVHGKATILQKMNGAYEQKFPQARALYLYMFAHPGKKLNFMGNELGQLREWDESREQDWLLMNYPAHSAFARFVRDLQRLYLCSPALWERDFEREGFVWLDCQSKAACVYAFERRGKSQRILALLHLSDREAADYALRIPAARRLTPLISSEWELYGGKEPVDTTALALSGGEISLTLGAYSSRLYLVE